MILICLWGLVPYFQADFTIITAETTPLSEISRAQLRALYLKRIDRIDGVRVKPIQYRKGAIHDGFTEWLYGPTFDIANHWIEERLRGGERPPPTAPNTPGMLLYVARNPGMIGYVAAGDAGSIKNMNIKVLRVRR